MSLLDVIGPVMVGPSSSHTAGACRIALLARHCLGCQPDQAQLELHGSFAKTGKGHGTHQALLAGLLGCYPDDERIPKALELAKAAGLEFDFMEKDLGDVHPNTVRLNLQKAEAKVSVVGSSLGAGLVKMIRINQFEANFSGSYHTLLIEHDDKPGVIARVARVLADDEVNIATIHSARQKRGGKALMSIEMDKRPAQYALEYLTNVSYISWLRMLPEVMSGDKHDAE
ncbi:MAG: L-serine ammonia-lyase, iron-sulfur-dependent subunit beta [Trueperaceae bacterium]|nr:L-serine ammonia-lyase, iron-sulfur-dependent subunit beta [Trueperaceae bacterium]